MVIKYWQCDYCAKVGQSNAKGWTQINHESARQKKVHFCCNDHAYLWFQRVVNKHEARMLGGRYRLRQYRKESD